MRRLLFSALMMVCSVSWAGWEYTDTSDKITFFHDKSTIRRNDGIAKMWTLYDHSVIQTYKTGERWKSEKVFFAYNCKEQTFASIAMIHYSGGMGTGKVVWSGISKEDDLEWAPISPGSIGEVRWKIACGKK